MVRIGLCVSPDQVEGKDALPGDYLEISVMGVLRPESPPHEFEERLRRARALGLPVEAANVFLPPDLPLISSPTQAVDDARLERYVRTAIARSSDAGINVIVFGSGAARMCPSDISPPDATRQLQDHLARWAGWSGDAGVTLVIEPLRREETNMLNTVAEAAALVAEIDKPRLRLLVDTYHMAANGESPEDIRPWADLIGHVHVAEHEGRRAPGTSGESFEDIFAILKDAGYAGRISIECAWNDPVLEARSAVNTVRLQWARC